MSEEIPFRAMLALQLSQDLDECGYPNEVTNYTITVPNTWTSVTKEINIVLDTDHVEVNCEYHRESDHIDEDGEGDGEYDYFENFYEYADPGLVDRIKRRIFQITGHKPRN